MKVNWISGLSAQQKDELVSNFKASALTRERLATLLRNKIETRRRETRSVATYETASWSYLQADGIGYERALEEIISLILEKNVEKG